MEPLKGVFAKNEGDAPYGEKKSLFIASNLASSPFQLEEFVNHWIMKIEEEGWIEWVLYSVRICIIKQDNYCLNQSI